MEYLTSVILSGAVYDIVKDGAKVTADNLKSRLRNWLLNEKELKILAEHINNIEQLEDLNEKGIVKKIETDDAVLQIIQNTKQDSSVNQITQSHTGSGDNVGGSKNVYNNKR